MDYVKPFRINDGTTVLVKLRFKNFALDRWEILVRVNYSISPEMNVTLSFATKELMEAHFERFTLRQARYFYESITGTVEEAVPDQPPRNLDPVAE
jgi:hypothetical protein